MARYPHGSIDYFPVDASSQECSDMLIEPSQKKHDPPEGNHHADHEAEHDREEKSCHETAASRY